jgi:hypothetical protein
LINASLLTDGSSDRVLIPMLEWLVGIVTSRPLSIQWVDLRSKRSQLTELGDRVNAALRLYPCDVLFVHRDAERQPAEWRHQEIATAVPPNQKGVAVVPVRMQEAWLLHDENALRKAAGRPSGTEPLDLPSLSRLETLADPKRTLHAALLTAAAVTGRRRRAFDAGGAARRLAELIEDWTPLRQLPAFRQLEADTRKALRGLTVLRPAGDLHRHG